MDLNLDRITNRTRAIFQEILNSGGSLFFVAAFPAEDGQTIVMQNSGAVESVLIGEVYHYLHVLHNTRMKGDTINEL